MSRDITGQKYNRLTVINPEWKKDKSGYKQKECQCAGNKQYMEQR